jgi:PAS domain S-box-containing protein
MRKFLKKLLLSKQEYSVLIENEKWLRETELRMDHLINKTEEMICTFSVDGRLLFGNRSFRTNSHYSKEELTGLTVDDLLSPGSKSNVYANLRRVTDGEAIHNVVCKLVAKNGDIIYAEGSLIPIVEDGVYKGAQAFFRNINDKIDAAQQRLEYIAVLEDMLFAFSHKIRKPVATCLGLIDILNIEEQLTEESIKQYAEYLKTSIRELDLYVHEMSNTLNERRKKISMISGEAA